MFVSFLFSRRCISRSAAARRRVVAFADIRTAAAVAGKQIGNRLGDLGVQIAGPFADR